MSTIALPPASPNSASTCRRAQQKLLAFRDLLLKWNKTYNLTALRDPEQAISHHLLDSLAILPMSVMAPCSTSAPAAACPAFRWPSPVRQLSVTMVDTVQKKATFLQQAAIELGLKNVTAHHARVEEMNGQYAQISSRAFAELKLFVELTRHLLAPGGRWLAMKGIRPDDEIAACRPTSSSNASFRCTCRAWTPKDI
jgi:16S rRNA (guanine527-N7)-methyltransferase